MAAHLLTNHPGSVCQWHSSLGHLITVLTLLLSRLSLMSPPFA